MKKLKNLFNKLIDKIFGKRCQCLNKQRVMGKVLECLDCGKLIR